MKFALIFMFFFSSILISSAQTVGSELQMSVDYFNLFSRTKNTTVYKEAEEHQINLGLKLQTTIHHRLDVGLSFDVLSVLDDVRFLKRAHLYGVFVYYEFLPSDKRVNFDLAFTLRGAKFRSVLNYPYYEDANWSLYGGARMHISYRPLEKLPNLRIYTGIHLSFPTFRHSFWVDYGGVYSELNLAYLGVSYSLGSSYY